MPKVSLVGVDTAGGGVILGPGASKLSVGGVRVSLVGDSIAPHGPPPHITAVVLTGSNKLSVGGVPVTIQGSATSCGHDATGSAKLSVSS